MESIKKYSDFTGKLSQEELQNLVIRISDEERWVSLSQEDLFFRDLRRNGIFIKNEDEMNYFRNTVYGELRRKTKDLPPYITKVEENKNKSFEELHWIPNEPIAFDSDDREFPSPFYISLPYKIIQGEHEGGFRIHFLLDKREDFTLYTNYPLFGIWDSSYEIYEKKDYSLIVNSAYSGKKAIIDRLNEYNYFRECAKDLSKGKFKLLKHKDKIKNKKLLEMLKD